MVKFSHASFYFMYIQTAILYVRIERLFSIRAML